MSSTIYENTMSTEATTSRSKIKVSINKILGFDFPDIMIFFCLNATSNPTMIITDPPKP